MPDGNAPVVAPADPKTLNLHQRLHAVMLEVDYVQKDKKIEHGGGYKVVTHDAVTGKVRPVLVKHRVAYYPQNLRHVQNGNRTEIMMDVLFVNIDDPQDRIAVPTLGYGIDPGDKGPGKAVSYAVKYALLKALGLETGDDADEDGTAKHAPELLPAPQKSPPGISKAKIEVREAVREINSCEDGDQLLALLDAPDMKKLAVRVCREFPSEWIGPEQGSGLKGMIQKIGDESGVAPTVGNWLRRVEEAARKADSVVMAG